MAYTKYQNLTDEELLQELNTRRLESPVIDELCKRLPLNQLVEKDKRAIETQNTHSECPVCEARIKLVFDDANSMFFLKLGD